MDSGLASKVRSEKAASNNGDVYEHAVRLNQRFGHVFACPNTVHAEQLFDGMLASIARDRVVLEYGCFNGWSIPLIASYGPRKIVGIDISERWVAEAKRTHGQMAEFSVMDGHRLALEDASVDVVRGRAILHHLDFDVAIREIWRVLRPGGHALFFEPLRDNPAAKVLRMLTPKARTRDERPRSRAQIDAADKLFQHSAHFFAGLASVPCGMVSSLVSKDPGNAVMRLAHRIDLRMARTSLRYWMRVVVLRWTK